MDVFINRVSKFLPNKPVGNDELETYFGMVGKRPSKARAIVLRQNGIKQRYYSLVPRQNIDEATDELRISHTNAELAAEAIRGLFDTDVEWDKVELLSCGTSSPDQMQPSHASMVHGVLHGKPIDIVSPAGVCLSGIHAMKIAYLAIKSGEIARAVCSGSELVSPCFHASKFEPEYANTKELEENPYLAFDKDFLRFMLSDGAGAALLENSKRGEIALKIEWIESVSYANRNESCMYMAAEKQPDGELKSWKVMQGQTWLNKSIFSIRQDFRLLDREAIACWIKHLSHSLNKHNMNAQTDVDYFLPHLSSMVFHERLKTNMEAAGILVPPEKWFINLPRVGNVGSASIYLALEELLYSGILKKGERIILAVPESGRFSYGTVCLKVV